MYPYKIVSKKGAKLSSGVISSNNSIIIPVSSSEEYNPRTQLALMVEILAQNRAKVLEKIESDLDDTSKPFNSEFPSVVRVLKENGLLHFFLKNFHASVVDEFEELMDQIEYQRVRNPSISDQEGTNTDQNEDGTNNSENLESSASVISTENYSDKEYEAIDIVLRNQQFLGIGKKLTENERLTLERREIRKQKQRQNEENRKLKWVEDSSEESSTIFDFEFVLLTNYKLYSPSDSLIKSLAPKPPEEKAKPMNKIKEFSPKKKEIEPDNEIPQSKPELDANQQPKSTQRLDYCYYEYKIERLPPQEEQPDNSTMVMRKTSGPSSSHKKSRDDHHEVEVSTRSEEFQEEVIEFPEKATVDEPEYALVESPDNKSLSKAAKKKLKKLKKKDEAASIVATIEDPPLIPENSPPSEISETVTKGKKKKNANQSAIKPIEPLIIDEIFCQYEPMKEKLKQKEMEKLKQDTKDHLKEQLLKIPTVENLDEFEKACVVEINSLDSLTKKMKQKARRKLRQEIDNEKVNRNEKIAGQNPDDFEDDYEDDSKKLLDFFLNNGKNMNLSEKDLARMCLENPTHILMNLRNSGFNLNSLYGRKLSSILVKDQKIEAKGKKKEMCPQKYKEKIQGTIEKLDIELGNYEEKIEQADNINNLFQQFSDSSLKSVLNILHEDFHAIKENFIVARSNKVGEAHSRRPVSSLSCQTIPS